MLAGQGETATRVYCERRSSHSERPAPPQQVTRKVTVHSQVPAHPRSGGQAFTQKAVHKRSGAALVTTVRSWEQPKCPSADEWINDTQSIRVRKGYSTVSRTDYNHTPQHGRLENATLSQRRQTQKPTCCGRSTIQDRQIHRDGLKVSSCQVLGRRETAE